MNNNKLILFFVSSLILSLLFYEAMTFNVDIFMEQINSLKFYIHIGISLLFGLLVAYLIILRRK